MTTLKARKRTHEVVSANEYIKRRKKDPKSVEGAKILSPKLGSKSFGGFLLKRDTPEYEVL